MHGYDILIKIKELRAAQEQAYNILFRYHNNLAWIVSNSGLGDMLSDMWMVCSENTFGE